MFYLWYLLIGLGAGWLANILVRGGGSGLFINLIVGAVGGLLGGWLVSMFGWIASSTIGTLIASLIGAIFLLLIVSMFFSRAPADER